MDELRAYLSKWDKANNSQREKILADFVARSRDMTGPELDREYGNGASLLLARICAFLKTRTTGGRSVGTAMQAICVFVSAASGHRFLAEFLDVGGLEMVLGMLADTQLSETDRMRSLQVLSSIANSGYTYKQMILDEKYNVLESVCGYMESATTEAAQELSRSVLIGLGRGHKRMSQLQARLIKCLNSENALVLRTAAQVLRQLVAPGMGAEDQEISRSISSNTNSLVEAVGGMFARAHVHVLYEALELAQTALVKPGTCERMIEAIVEMLRPESYNTEHLHLDIATDPTMYSLSGAAPPLEAVLLAASNPQAAFRKQSASARLIAALIRSKDMPRVLVRPEVVGALVEQGVVLGLLVAMSNTEHPESCKHAIDALAVLLRASPPAAAHLSRLAGSAWMQNFKADPAGSAYGLDRAVLVRLLSGTGNVEQLRFHERPPPPPPLPKEALEVPAGIQEEEEDEEDEDEEEEGGEEKPAIQEETSADGGSSAMLI